MTENKGEPATEKPSAKRAPAKKTASTAKKSAKTPGASQTDTSATEEKPTPDETASTSTAAPSTATATKAEPKEKKRSSKSVGATVRQAFDLTRDRLGRLVGLLCLLAAAFLAVGALLIALRANINGDNPVVRFIVDVAGVVDGPLSRADGIFHFDGKNAMTKNALVNWGLAAIVWLIVGRILSRLIRP